MNLVYPLSGTRLYVGQELTLKVNTDGILANVRLFPPGQTVYETWPPSFERPMRFDSPGTYRITAVGVTWWDELTPPVELSLDAAPLGVARFIKEPIATFAHIGDSASFSVEVSSFDEPRLQWLFDGAPISGETNSVLQLTNIQSVQEGRYSVWVDNHFGRTLSDEASLDVVDAPQPIGGGLIRFSNKTEGIDAPIRSGITGELLGTNGLVQLYAGRDLKSMEPASSWLPLNSGYFDGGDIALENVAPGETAFVQIFAWETDSFGRYDYASSAWHWKSKILQVTTGTTEGAPLIGLDGFSTAIWDGYFLQAAGLLIQTTPIRPGSMVTLGTQYFGKFVWTGETVTNITYQWFKNGFSLDGATNATIAIGPVTFEDVARYSVVVSDGREITVPGVALTIEQQSTPFMVPKKALINNLPNLGAGFELFARAGSAFRIETSPDMKTWTTWKSGLLPNGTVNTNLTFFTVVDSGGFFRANVSE